MSLVEHLENHLGAIDRGWAEALPRDGVQVARFIGRPSVGANTFVTLGHSGVVLPAASGRRFRQELVVCAYSEFESSKIASFLLTLSSYIRTNGRALLRGEVIGPSTSLIPGSSLVAVYATLPFDFDDGFSVFREDAMEVVLVRLLGITFEEAGFLREYGWEALEDQFERKDVDVLDWNRPSVL